MPKYAFALQHTAAAYNETPPESAWKPYSRHTTATAAGAACQRAYAEMRRLCGPGCWSDHFRIIALVDITVSRSCDTCDHVITRSYRAGETVHTDMCLRPDSNYCSPILCAPCRKRENQSLDEERERLQRETEQECARHAE